jgi:hypothetical protein
MSSIRNRPRQPKQIQTGTSLLGMRVLKMPRDERRPMRNPKIPLPPMELAKTARN